MESLRTMRSRLASPRAVGDAVRLTASPVEHPSGQHGAWLPAKSAILTVLCRNQRAAGARLGAGVFR
jgi:hypothetical protein